jgi:dihydrofolate synthase/folylpolyglutamate synthase
METGVGGRYDPSNLLPSKLAVITNVDYDHVQSLGPTLKDIANHKSGIIKKNQPVITASNNSEVLDVLANEAKAQNSTLFRIKKDFDFQIHKIDEHGVNLSVDGPFHTYANLQIAAPGLFQAENAALSISAIDLLANQHHFSLTQESLVETFKTVKIAGRMEIIQRNPVVILDGAHNPHKMQSLADSLRLIYPNKAITVIVGILKTKDAKTILDIIIPLADQLIVTKPYVLGKPSIEPSELANDIHEIDARKDIQIANNVKEAIALSLKNAQKDDLIVITGSLYMLGDARNYWITPESLLQVS